MIVASCHCGAVKIEADRRPDGLTQCTCSICRRYGAQWFYCTRTTARVVSGADRTRAYKWNDEVIEFHHCRTCGCLTHYESVERDPDSRVAINARMVDPGELDGVRLRTFDGADTWTFID